MSNLVPVKGSAEHEEHLLRLACHIVGHLFTWTGAADGGVHYGYERNDEWVAAGLSREEILSLLDWPRPDDAEEWPDEVREYAWSLLADVGAFLRERCDLGPVTEADVEIADAPPERPPVCGHRVKDLVWNDVACLYQCTECGRFNIWP